MKQAVIVLPTYNEKDNIAILIPEIFSLPTPTGWEINVLVVDDASPDDTQGAVKKLQKKFSSLHLITGDKKGLGNAYRRGFKWALQNLAPDIFIEMDSDMQHDPKLIPQFISAIEGGADYVLGSRYIKGGSIPRNWAFHRKFLSYVGNSLVLRLGFMKPSVHDWTTGYKAIRADFISKYLVDFEPYDGYTFQIATLDKALKTGLTVREIPLVFKNRAAGKSKINTFDFISRNLTYIFFNSPFVKYAIVGFLTAGLDFGISYFLIHQAVWPVRAATVVSAGVAVVTNFTLNNFWSFSFKKIPSTRASYIKSFIKFVLVSFGSVSIQTILLGLSTDALGIRFWYIYKALIIGFIIIPYSYTVYNLFIWKKKNKMSL